MNIVNTFKSKTIGAFMGMGIILLSILSLIFYLVYATSSDELMMPLVIVFLVLVIVGEIATFFFDNDYIPVAVAALTMASVGCFAISPIETIGSITDFFNGGMVMFGNPDNFGIIMTILIFLLITTITAIVACFFKRVKQPSA